MLAKTLRLNWYHLTKQILRPLGRVAAQVAFTNLGAHNLARPSHAKAFGGRFMSLHLVLAFSLFASHDQTPLMKILRLYSLASAVGPKPTKLLSTAEGL